MLTHPVNIDNYKRMSELLQQFEGMVKDAMEKYQRYHPSSTTSISQIMEGENVPFFMLFLNKYQSFKFPDEIKKHNEEQRDAFMARLTRATIEFMEWCYENKLFSPPGLAKKPTDIHVERVDCSDIVSWAKALKWTPSKENEKIAIIALQDLPDKDDNTSFVVIDGRDPDPKKVYRYTVGDKVSVKADVAFVETFHVDKDITTDFRKEAPLTSEERKKLYGSISIPEAPNGRKLIDEKQLMAAIATVTHNLWDLPDRLNAMIFELLGFSSEEGKKKLIEFEQQKFLADSMTLLDRAYPHGFMSSLMREMIAYTYQTPVRYSVDGRLDEKAYHSSSATDLHVIPFGNQREQEDDLFLVNRLIGYLKENPTYAKSTDDYLSKLARIMEKIIREEESHYKSTYPDKVDSKIRWSTLELSQFASEANLQLRNEISRDTRISAKKEKEEQLKAEAKHLTEKTSKPELSVSSSIPWPTRNKTYDKKPH